MNAEDKVEFLKAALRSIANGSDSFSEIARYALEKVEKVEKVVSMDLPHQLIDG